ncbi:MAG TPA: EGF domain-containing protein [Polyangiaceae bacterium LLY-WYZ-15_(1-7)]|nr:EGF domain-containing protein [Polyangiaceae bacterium LLY-WYZ-15_(1-7)]HJL09499.1 EGF domain-containing protein [Polyangiaceae bacterium LLY-WYZ-15_(1-7)]HJL31762.1 EGF domain-containing protein [Polyangiaceae bacterium LLY-WYZ-15_(1-7)]
MTRSRGNDVWRAALAWALVALGASTASANYPGSIPNGYFGGGGGRCIVCHTSDVGGTGCGSPPCLNSFGNNFYRGPNGVPFDSDDHTWSRWLAARDSDGDGWTNGQELGDPFALWSGSGSPPSGYRANPGQSGNEPSNFNLCNNSAYNDCGGSRDTCNDSYSGSGRWVCGCGTGSTGTGYRRTTSHNWSGGVRQRYSIRSVPVAGCTDINECFPTNPCGSGSCSERDPLAGYTCSCFSGYVFNGTTCVNENECSTMPGICGVGSCSDRSPPTDYICTCPGGYGFDGTTCVIENACLADTDDCDTNATCTPVGETDWSCACNEGWTGVGSPARGTGDRCVDINECITMAGICGVGSCRNNAGGYTCTCPDGYVFDGDTCVDVNECPAEPCGIGGSCMNTPGAYVCDCDPGYEFTGGTCVDIDECAGNPCTDNGECRQTDPPGYFCTCNGGYEASGGTCVDIDECTMPDISLCALNASCTNTPGAWRCECNEGYTGDGRTCVDLDECSSPELNECDVQAICTNEEGSYDCTCADGYEGSGVTCDDIDECATGELRCDAGEVCENRLGMPAVCRCAPGFVRLEEGGECVRACGDGLRTPGEACDDGNTESGDGCSEDCEVEMGWSCWEPEGAGSTCEYTCGDGLVNESEECDDGEANADAPDACRTNCAAPTCGDGILDTGESCDEGEANSDEVAGACRTSCQPAFCGDGIVDEGEMCDPGGGSDLGAEACEVCTEPDAGLVDGGGDPMMEGDGGGCAAGGTPSGALWPLVALLFVRRRR